MNYGNTSLSFSHQNLVLDLKKLVGEERRIGLEILKYLQKIDQHMIYAALGYSSLWDFCVNELKYSQGAAYRRISSMRALREMPAIEEPIQKGDLSLSTVSQLQGFCQDQSKKNKPLTSQEKVDLFKKAEGKSKKEVEKVLATIDPQMALPDKEKPLSSKLTHIEFTADEELTAQLKEIKDLAAATIGFNPSMNDLLKYMAKIVLKQKQNKIVQPKQTKTVTFGSPAEVIRVKESEEVERKESVPSKVEIKRVVFREAGNQCQFTDPLTKRRCSSTRALQIDHVLPKALGGSDELSNLRLLCFTHNQFMAVKFFGVKKMAQFKQTSCK